MTDKEQIIINGVDVGGCSVYKNGLCLLTKNKCNARCDYASYYLYEQLARKIQECEALKKRNEDNERFYLKQYAKKDSEVLDLTHQLNVKTQECEKLSILAQEESARNGYVEYELNDKLKQKTQECENLKAEEKYLKQCCEKAGEELAKHSFEYDGKEKNLVVQAMELNEKYEKLEKALEEIEKYCGQNRHAGWVDIEGILDIINKAK